MKKPVMIALVFVAMLSLCGCPNLVNPPSRYNKSINSGLQQTDADIAGAEQSNQSAAQSAAAAQTNTQGARSALKSADGRLATMPQNAPVPQARGDIGSADQKLVNVQSQLAVVQAAVTKEHAAHQDALVQLAALKDTASQQQTAISNLESTVKTLQAFYDKWCNAWLGPRLHHWFTGIFVAIIIIGVLWALMTCFPMFAPILATIEGLIGPVLKHVLTAGIPAVVTFIKYLITRCITLVQKMITTIEAWHAARVTAKPQSKPAPAQQPGK